MPPTPDELKRLVMEGKMSPGEYDYYMRRYTRYAGIVGPGDSPMPSLYPSLTYSWDVAGGTSAERKKPSFLKVGDKLEAIDKDLYDAKDNAAYIQVTSIDDDGEVDYDIFDEDDNKLDCGSVYIKKKQVKAYKPKVKPKITLDSVVMTNEKREQIQAAIAQMEHQEMIFTTWGFSEVIEKGKAISLLFYGPPGTGKTLTAQAIADTLDLKLKIIQTAEVESSEPGQCERNIKAFFENAVKQKQLLLFDECDSLINDRTEVGMILAAQINALLTALENYTGVVIFTTNRLAKMDAAFERRVSAKIEFELPDEVQRLAIWQRLIPKKAPVCKKVKLETLARIPLPGGNIKNAVLTAARFAAYRGKKAIDEECFAHAVDKEWKSMKSFRDALASKPNIPSLIGSGVGKIADIQKTVEVERSMDKVAEMKPTVDFSTPPSRA